MKKSPRSKLYQHISVITCVVLIIILFEFFTNVVSQDKPSITINNHTIAVELARSEVERKQGLSDRALLPPDTGLLFIFPTKDHHAFWNYHMKFPIDVLWIDDTTVVDKTSFPIDLGQPMTYHPNTKATYVLEVNAGLADRNDWVIGAIVILPKSLRQD